MEPTQIIETIRKLALSGNMVKALELLKVELERHTEHKGNHEDWANVCEELGVYNAAFRELNLAFRDDPSNPRIIERLSVYYLERGETQRATALLERLLSIPAARAGAVETLADVYLSRGDEESVQRLIATVVKYGLDETTAKKIVNRRRDDGLAKPLSYEEEEKPAAFMPTDDELVRFLHLFSGREDIYARQWYSAFKNKGGYSPVHEPLTPRILRQHFVGDATIGVYCLRLDSTVTFFAFDIDITKNALERIHSQQEGARIRMELKRSLTEITSLLAAQDLDFLIESSGYKGYHVWSFLQTPLPAEVLVNFGKLVLAKVRPKLPLEIGIEFFPKQAQISDSGFSNLIKLPLGIHLKTGKRSQFYTKDMVLAEKPFDLLKQVKLTPKATLFAAIETLKRGQLPIEPRPKQSTPFDEPGSETPESEPLPPGAASATAEYRGPSVLASWTEADFNYDPDVKTLFERCPVLASLKQKVDANGVLDYDEIVVLQNTLGHLPRGVMAVNYLFSRCANLSPEYFLKSTLKGNPISCPKIRARIPGVTSLVDCSCNFKDINHYPTPLLHLDSVKDQDGGATYKQLQKRPALDEDVIDVARKYLRLISLQDRVKADLHAVKNSLWNMLINVPDRCIVLPEGILTAVAVEGVKGIEFKVTAQKPEVPAAKVER